MALGLHQNALNLMKAELEKSVGSIQIDDGCIIEPMTSFFASYFANEKIPKNGKTYEKLLDFVGDLPLVDYVNETLRREIVDLRSYEKGAKTTLDKIDGYENASVVADRLVQGFKSLLWSYTFSFEIPESMIMQEVVNGDLPPYKSEFRLVGPDLFLEQVYPLTHENQKVASRAKGSGILALLAPSALWSKDRAHFQSEIDGFVGVYGSTPTVRSMENKIESFVGLGIANRIFTYNYKYENKNISSQWIVHKKSGDSWEFDARFDLDESLRETLRHIKSFSFSESYPIEDRPRWVSQRLNVISEVFSSSESRSIVLAAKWFFDSYKKGDDSLSFVRLMTALEILLGEKLDTSRSSIGETIGNRLAYLIGKNRSERAEILEYFKNIYRTRSKILHNGKHRLVGEEKTQLSKLRDYALRAIFSECEALTAV